MQDVAGIRGVAVADDVDPNSFGVTLPDGARTRVPRSLVEHTSAGYRYQRAFEQSLPREANGGANPREETSNANSREPNGSANPREQNGSAKRQSLDGFEVLEETFEAIEESLNVRKIPVLREHVRVTTHVSTREEVVELKTCNEQISLERVPIGRVVAAAADPRTEGDTLIVPVYEEMYVVEKRLVLVEEVRLTRIRTEQSRSETVSLRSEQVNIEAVARDPKHGS